MLNSAIIVFRECLEAALIIGIIAAATRGLAGRGRWITGSVLVGLAGSLVVAAGADWISGLAEGAGQELFNAGVVLLAAGMLAWHCIWMSRHGRELAQSARSVGQAVASGAAAFSALGAVIALAVLREGSETVLFLYGLLAGGGQSIFEVAAGGMAGLAAGALAGCILYAGAVRLPMKAFFAVTNGLIALLAAQMASQGARFLAQADLLPSLADPLWDLSALLPDASVIGRTLNAVVGYRAMPSGIEVLFYALMLAVVLVAMEAVRRMPPPALSAR
jgi:high-affinity iron transporter